MLETVQIPIFLISLESATERRGYLLKHLKKLGADYSFLLAVIQTFLIHVFSDSSLVIYNFCAVISGLLGFFILIQAAETSLRASTLSVKVL